MKCILSSAAILAALVGFSDTSSAADKAVHWGYSGHEGPAYWGELSKKFETCKTGEMQSPIDLVGASVTGEISAETIYKPMKLNILNNGHTVQFMVGNGSKLKAYGKSYDLLQVHYHTPSEHIADGKPYPMEAHFVHKAKDGALAVIGVLYTEGAENQALKPIVANAPMKATPATKKDVTINPADLMPKHKDLFRYMGSLTTPPCSEGVNWFVIKTPVEASKKQIAAMNAAMGENARPAQAINNRLVVEPGK